MFSIVLCGFCCFPDGVWAAVYGVRNDKDEFVPKVTVTVRDKEILIEKKNPREEFESISIMVQRRNATLLKNVGLLKIQWIAKDGKPRKPLLFASHLYNPATRVYRDSMKRSRAVKIIDGSTRNLFLGKKFSDLFRLKINGKPCVSSESFYERDRRVEFKDGRDISIDVDKTEVVFTKDNYQKGEIINVDNRSGYNQTIGVNLPEKGLLYFQLRRSRRQQQIPMEIWDRFPLEADSGVFILLIPDNDPAKLAELNGKEVTIKVWDGARIRETIRIPIKVSRELLESPPSRYGSRRQTGSFLRERPPPEGEGETTGELPAEEPPGGTPGESTEGEARPSAGAETPGDGYSGVWIWVLLIFDLVLVVALGGYCVFFLVPKVQVLQDRLAKSEMFIHGTREAIREELEELKEEILRQLEERQNPPE